MEWLFIISFALYFLGIARIRSGLNHWIPKEPGNDSAQEITVIIPARNEEANISQVLEAILSQDIGSAFDVLVVDDHSEDKTVDMVREFQNRYPNLKLLRSTGQGKKEAIQQAANYCSTEWMVVTDADCTMDKDWLSSLSAAMDDHTNLVLGPVSINGGDVLADIQMSEQAALIAVGAGLLGMGSPSMANGANIAWRRRIFLELGGYSDNLDLPTGDDEFLLRSIHLNYPGSIFYQLNRKALVTTKAAASFTEFMNQRIRWASKWKRQHLPYLGVLLFLFYIVNLMALVYMVVTSSWWLALLIVGKGLLDYLLMRRIIKLSGQRVSIFSFLTGQILYPIYAIFIGILANLATYTWKGRKYSTT